MKMLIILLLLPVFMHAQTPAGNQRQLVSLAIKYEPDQMEEANKYYVVVNKPACVLLKDNQTFLVQSTWQNQGDSVTGIGAGTVQEINDSSAELVVTVYRGKKIKKGDMALFLVPLDKPLVDTIFFKMARLCINFTTVDDSTFYNRNSMLKAAETYPTKKLLEVMAVDVRRTGDAMIKINNNQDQKIGSGIYKDKMLFAMMQNVTAEDLLQFIYYVYNRPDKYKAHDWKISEIFATWAINGAPQVIAHK